MRRLVLIAVFVVSTAHAAPKIAATYAPMFEKGHHWHYTLAVTEFELVDEGGKSRLVPGAPEKSTFTCTVAGVATFDTVVVSEIVCDHTIDSDYAVRVDGEWIATKDGIARGADLELPQKPADVNLAAKVIAMTPKPSRSQTKSDYGGIVVSTVSSPTRDTWCTSTDTTKYGVGDGGIVTLCFKAGVGLVSGKNDYSGGTPRIVEYRATP